MNLKGSHMNRKTFIKNMCATGICACAGSAVLALRELNAQTSQEKEDWRVGFGKTRYTHLLKIIQEKVSPEAFEELIEEQGRFCSGQSGTIKKFQGDLEGYLKMLKESWHEDSVYDKENGIITVASEDRTECFCPMIDTHKVSDAVCNCSLGWQKQTYETVLGKQVDVKIKESLIRGGKKCIFEVKILS